MGKRTIDVVDTFTDFTIEFGVDEMPPIPPANYTSSCNVPFENWAMWSATKSFSAEYHCVQYTWDNNHNDNGQWNPRIELDAWPDDLYNLLSNHKKTDLWI